MRNKKPYVASITTNGYDLDKETFSKLLKCKVLYYQITIDGLKETHDKQRALKDGSPSFEKIINNLITIKNEVTSKHFTITIRTNFSKDMLFTIDEYKSFFYENFGNDSRFQFFIRPVLDWGGERIQNFKDKLIEHDMLSQVFQKLAEDKMQKISFSYLDFLEPGGCVCYAAAKNHYVIAVNGEIFKCTCDFKMEKENKVGILKDGKMLLDKSKTALWLCDMQYCQNKDCFFAPLCLRNECPAQRIKKSKHKCPLEKEYLDSVLLLLDAQNNIFKAVKE